jgi:hydroxymethylpyrimidine pyrophosphatase-like HAD family hydrolase
MKLLTKKGVINKNGDIVFFQQKPLLWESISDKKFPRLPEGTILEFTVSFDENRLISGSDGIVWATKDLLQAEIIFNALFVQKIESEIIEVELEHHSLFLIKIQKENDIKEVIEFISQSESGLRLKPDWSYPSGEPNRSFNEWLNGQ